MNVGYSCPLEEVEVDKFGFLTTNTDQDQDHRTTRETQFTSYPEQTQATNERHHEGQSERARHALNGATDHLTQHNIQEQTHGPSPQEHPEHSIDAKSSYRSSISSVPDRDYILDLADPSWPAPADGRKPGASSCRNVNGPRIFSKQNEQLQEGRRAVAPVPKKRKLNMVKCDTCRHDKKTVCVSLNVSSSSVSAMYEAYIVDGNNSRSGIWVEGPLHLDWVPHFACNRFESCELG
jgi:hypothetical protein